jgi:hypothetical protein
MITGSGDYLPIEGTTCLTNAKKSSVPNYTINKYDRETGKKQERVLMASKAGRCCGCVPNPQLAAVPFHSDRVGRQLVELIGVSVLARSTS